MGPVHLQSQNIIQPSYLIKIDDFKLKSRLFSITLHGPKPQNNPPYPIKTMNFN